MNKNDYSLKAEDILSAQQIRNVLSPQWKQMEIDVYDTIDSTNSQAKRELSAGNVSEKLIVAQMQTAGRGRRGRSFYSPKDMGIYMSLILRPQLNLQDSLLITSAVAVAVCRALDRYAPGKIGIKWVNDIYLNGKKICGILTEAISDFELGALQSVIIGIGINLRPQEFPEELTQAASIGRSDISRNEVIGKVTNAVMEVLAHLKEAQVLAEYRKRSILLGKGITFEQNGNTCRATALDIDEHGGLVVRTEQGRVVTLNSGEITVRNAE